MKSDLAYRNFQFFNRFGWNSGQQVSILCHWAVASFIKIGVVKVTLCLRASVKYALFSSFSSDLSKRIRYRRYPQKCGALMNVYRYFPHFSWKMGGGNGALSQGRKWNYVYACTLKPYGVLIVKNPLVKAVFRGTEHTVCSLVALGRILHVPHGYKCCGLRSGDLGGHHHHRSFDRDSDTLQTRTRTYVGYLVC
jgi:hypothetical protein